MFEISDSKQSIVFWSVVALAFWMLILALNFFLPEFYIWLGTEDALGENMTSVFYFGAGIFLLAHSVREIRKGHSSVSKDALPILLALFFIFVGGEEISWGQRLLGIETPALVSEHNYQNEFNLHNLTIFGVDSALLDPHTILNLIALMMGVLIPLANRYISWFRDLLAKIHYPVQQLALIMWFVTGLLHGQTIAKIDPHWAHTEVKELIYSIGFCLFGFGLFLNSSKPGRSRL